VLLSLIVFTEGNKENEDTGIRTTLLPSLSSVDPPSREASIFVPQSRDYGATGKSFTREQTLNAERQVSNSQLKRACERSINYQLSAVTIEGR
jgi:hypothetical protein